ncbi:MAG: hypothetical protein HWN65_15395 [Candidatus Helarchaeota archaeon]|nr:hypothetical protein [Candidatus Helarchaeota archaeon]
MKLDWKKVAFEIPCPKCQEVIDKYENLEENQWNYVQAKSPDPLRDYHKCPHCQRMWAILQPHTDEDPLEK